MKELYWLQKQDIPKAREVLRSAFQDDPVWRKVFEHQEGTADPIGAFFETPIRLQGIIWVEQQHRGESRI